MADQNWYYNYQAEPNQQNYQHGQYEYNYNNQQWPQYQNYQNTNQYLPYPPITQYPTPIGGPFSVPPPCIPNVPPPSQGDFNYYPTYPNAYPQASGTSAPNDFAGELQSYKNIKSGISGSSSSYPPPNDKSNRRSKSLSPRRSISSRTERRPSPRRRSRSRSRERRPRRYESRTRSSERSKSDRGPRSESRRQSERPQPSKPQTERDQILTKWRKNYCSTSQQITSKLEELGTISTDELLEREQKIWTRSTPADLYYARDESNMKIIKATPKLVELCNTFNETLVKRASKVNALKPIYEPPPRKNRARLCKHKTEAASSDTSEDDLTDEEDCTMEELQRKQLHPDRLHPEMWYNEPGEMNDGPLCRCSMKSRKSGIRHGIYPGEKSIEKCNLYTNNSDRLYHYRITISPPTNFLIKAPTIIQYDEHEFIFEGFSILTHSPLAQLPPCKVIRFNIEYTILYVEEKIPDNFTICELDLFFSYVFKEILELVDLDFKPVDDNDGCDLFHFMPRFVRELPDHGKEILCMKEVLNYFLANSMPLIEKAQLEEMVKMSQYDWQNYADEIKGMVVTYPGKKPCSVRVDQLDRNIDLQNENNYQFPEIVHFGIRPPQLSYAGNPDYQKAWRDYVKFRHLLANMSKPTYEDKRQLEAKENKLQEMRTQGKMKRDVTVAVSSEGFYKTGIMCDIIQHAMLIPVLVCHLRFHHSLDLLEETVKYKFKNRALLQLALTHPSYRENFGTNPDHARNSLTNCGIRQPEYGDRRIHYMNTRKRGINTLINIMSRFGKQQETESNITHNERLEFLGDAVVEFLSSIHLFFSFPDLEEGGLATYRAAIVQNQHLSVLARILNLDQYMLYAHGSDLCHDLELRHAMANCFEALMGSLFLDGGIEVADKVFSTTFFHDKPVLRDVWVNLPPHPLQEQEPLGDRQWIEKFDFLKKLTEFEKSINVKFKHIRLLARAFTDRSVGYTNLTMGSNQRLEFLGDTVLQLIASDYLYKFFPEHHEGHLSLLRSSLVNNRTQAVVCNDLDMAKYAVYHNAKAELKIKDKADLLEAFIGALYVDQGMEYCEVFCQVTLFPRLQDFIMNQDWNDPKSKLQQCCLTLRTMDGREPEIPVYKVIECKGPTNTRVYTVAVYFQGKRLASAVGHSIQQAEMNAAKKALEISQDLFPQLDHQKRVIAKSMKKQKSKKRGRNTPRANSIASPPRSPESYSRNRFKSACPKSGFGRETPSTSGTNKTQGKSSTVTSPKCNLRKPNYNRFNTTRSRSRSREHSYKGKSINNKFIKKRGRYSKSPGKLSHRHRRSISKSPVNLPYNRNQKSYSKSPTKVPCSRSRRKYSKSPEKNPKRLLRYSRSRSKSFSRKRTSSDRTSYNSRSRSRSKSNNRSRIRKRIRSRSRSSSKSRPRSSSKSRSRSRSRSIKHRSKSRSGSRSTKRSKNRTNCDSRSESRSRSRSIKRSKTKTNLDSRSRSRSRSCSRNNRKSRSKSKSRCRSESLKRSMFSAKHKTRSRSRSKSFNKTRIRHNSRSRSISNSRSRSKSSREHSISTVSD